MNAAGRPDSPAATGDGRIGGHPTAISSEKHVPDWWIYRGTGRPLRDIDLRELLPDPPPWRDFRGAPLQPPPPAQEEELARRLGPASNLRGGKADPREIDAVNAALYLRRPLLVTGKPGVGKSSLAYRISRELRLGRVLRWPISSRSTLRGALYEYDAIGRAQEAAAARSALYPPAAAPAPRPAGEKSPEGNSTAVGALSSDDAPGIGDYVRLGPLGTALLPYELPRVLLIDELDKSDIDLPNDLLDVFEEGEYLIPELVRASAREPDVSVYTDDPGTRTTVHQGHVRCRAFPVIVITSNAEREFPPAFLRRCLRLEMREPDEEQLAGMVTAHFGDHAPEMIREFLAHRRVHGTLANDQLLNAYFLHNAGASATDPDHWQRLLDLLWQRLGQHEAVAE